MIREELETKTREELLEICHRQSKELKNMSSLFNAIKNQLSAFEYIINKQNQKSNE